MEAKEITCPICGKIRCVDYPQDWTYKRSGYGGQIFLCSYGCMRKFDKEREEEKMNTNQRDRIEVAKQLLEAVDRGENPIDYLKSLKYGNPAQAYTDIKKFCKTHRPDLYEKFPQNLRSRKTEIREADMSANTTETPESPKASAPFNYDGFKVQKVKGRFASYDLGIKCSDGAQILTVDTGLDEISFDVKDWPAFIDEFAVARKILGV